MISRGRVDPDEATVTYMDRRVELSRVERIGRTDLGGVALCWLSYHPGHGGFGTPHLVVMSREAADVIESTVAGIDPEIDEEYTPDRAVQATLGVFALCSFGLAALVSVVEPGSVGDPALRWYLVCGFGLFGGLFALAAVVSG